MKKNIVKSIPFVMVMAMCMTTTSCSNDDEIVTPPSPKQKLEIEIVNDNLRLLNAQYSQSPTRLPKWLRWLLVGAADVGGLIMGDVGGAASLSTVVWTVTGKEKNETNSSQIQTGTNLKVPDAFKENQIIANGIPGQLHNNIIIEATNNDPNLLCKPTHEIVNSILNEATLKTGVVYTVADKDQIYTMATQSAALFDSNLTVTDYMNRLKTLTTNKTEQEAMDACAIVLEGLQYVDDTDTTYITQATDIVNASSLPSEQKDMILKGISVADGSAKLWNTDIFFK